MRVIAIDGPAGAGKSTVAAALADRLGLERLDTGAMYRALTLSGLRAGIDPGDGTELAKLLAGTAIDVGARVTLDGSDVTVEIRSLEVNAAVSEVASHPEVRQELVARQRAWAEERGGGVVEGRDIGTVVFPHATLKIYLTASPSERARRRADQDGLASAGDVAKVAAGIAGRDDIDSTRAASPLAVAADAHVIDSTARTLDEVVEEVLALL